MAFITSAPLTSFRPFINRAITRPQHLHTPRNPKTARMTTSPPTETQPLSLQSFLQAARDLGTVRFVSVSNGAVLETIGRFDYNMSTFSVPDKGTYLTLASVDKTFECHINLSETKRITLGKQKAKVGDHDLYVIRFRNASDGIVLSCMLMWDPSRGPGHYLHGAVEAFEDLQRRFGSEVALQN